MPDNLETISRLTIALAKHNAAKTLEVGDPKQSLFALAMKFLIVKTADLTEAVTPSSNFESFLGDLTVLTKVLQLP